MGHEQFSESASMGVREEQRKQEEEEKKKRGKGEGEENRIGWKMWRAS